MNTPEISYRTAESLKGTGRYEVDLDGTNAGWVTKLASGKWSATYIDDYDRIRKAGTYRTRGEAAREIRIQAS